ncbi:MAG: hypothetical protein LBB47_06310 [Spirochaetaceae bacterium]|jgi:hypothetical protein|nr:hypothetical protein [Spirochaetaceae bacterium]
MSYAGNEKLRRLLYARIDEYAGKPAGPETRRLLTLGDLQRELDESGIQIPGFSTLKRIKEWTRGTSDSEYTITCDELSGECFLCMEFYKNRFAVDRASFYIRFYDTKSQHRFIDESGIGLIYRLLENFKNIADEYTKLRGEIDRNEKLRRLTISSIETWLTLICKNISLPYHIVKMESQAVFYLLLRNGRQLEIYIPYNNFQQVMCELENTINKYVDLQNDCMAKVLISNCSNSIRWKDTE